MLQIAILNESTAITNAEIEKMIPAFSWQWNHDLAPAWGLQAANFAMYPSGVPPLNSWWVVFLDTSDQAGALAYHDLTTEGLPISKVFVKSLIADNASISVGATHEICEMGVDPWINGACQDSTGKFWATEICDPVEDDQYGFTIYGTLVTDFVYPAWFAPSNVTGKIDEMGHCKSAFQVLSGGYDQYFDPNKGWQQITGAEVRASKADPAKMIPGSRRERRARGHSNWKKSFGRS
jgi:hypothetical protein